VRSIAAQLRQGARSLVRSPAFTAVTVLTLAVGIATVTSIFTILDRVVLRPLPYPESDRLVWIHSAVPANAPDEAWGVSAAGLFEFESNATTLEAVGAADNVFVDVQLTLRGPDAAVRIDGDSVTAGLFDVLGARAAVGRLFDVDDDRPGAPPLTLRRVT